MSLEPQSDIVMLCRAVESMNKRLEALENIVGAIEGFINAWTKKTHQPEAMSKRAVFKVKNQKDLNEIWKKIKGSAILTVYKTPKKKNDPRAQP